MKKIPPLAALLLIATLAYCGHETAKALAKLESDTNLSDSDAVVQMAQAAWMYSSGENESFIPSTNDGKIRLTGRVIDTLPVTNLDQENFLRINMYMDAKFIWRLFRSAIKRKLDQLVFTRVMTLSNGETMELYRVRLDADRLRAIAGWDTADPYNTDDNDRLQSPQADEVVRAVAGALAVEMDNSSLIRIQ